jgi:hypothetical protein
MRIVAAMVSTYTASMATSRSYGSSKQATLVLVRIDRKENVVKLVRALDLIQRQIRRRSAGKSVVDDWIDYNRYEHMLLQHAGRTSLTKSSEW